MLLLLLLLLLDYNNNKNNSSVFLWCRPQYPAIPFYIKHTHTHTQDKKHTHTHTHTHLLGNAKHALLLHRLSSIFWYRKSPI